MEQKTIKFHNTPELTKAYVENWLVHARKDKQMTAAHIAAIEDILALINIAMQSLTPAKEKKND